MKLETPVCQQWSGCESTYATATFIFIWSRRCELQKHENIYICWKHPLICQLCCYVLSSIRHPDEGSVSAVRPVGSGRWLEKYTWLNTYRNNTSFFNPWYPKYENISVSLVILTSLNVPNKQLTMSTPAMLLLTSFAETRPGGGKPASNGLYHGLDHHHDKTPYTQIHTDVRGQTQLLKWHICEKTAILSIVWASINHISDWLIKAQ